MRDWVFKADSPGVVILIRLLVGGVFLSEGIQKFLFPAALGVGRFQKIGIPLPEFTAPFVGFVEIVCGTLLILGLATRLAAVPLIVNMAVAITTTKIPILMANGFWAMAHEARTDYSMLMGLLFLLATGGGAWSIDRLFASKKGKGSGAALTSIPRPHTG
jgi:putative oxidoreductase